MLALCALLAAAALPSLAGEAEGGARAPSFAPQPTAVVAPRGHSATLYCIVLHLGDKSVSWVRARDLQILAHAGAAFTADARVAAAVDADGARHALRIERLRAADAGRYECQLNTEPKMSLFFNLTVVDEPVPAVVVAALGRGPQSGVAGGAATLACEARYEPAPRLLPMPPLELQWRRRGAALRPTGARGLALDTERWPARLVSRLTLAELRADDAGEYVCAVGERAAALQLRVLPHAEGASAEAAAEAMQRDEGAGSGARRPAASALAALSGAALATLGAAAALLAAR